MTPLEVRDHDGKIEEIVASAADISIEHVRENNAEFWMITITTADGDSYLFSAPRLDLLLRTRLIGA